MGPMDDQQQLTEKSSHKQMIERIILSRFKQSSKFIKRLAIGICNEVYEIGLEDRSIIIRLSPYDKFLMGSHDHIPKLKALNIKVPKILAEDYSKNFIPLSYQILSKIEGLDLGQVIETLSDNQLKALAKEIASIFNKISTIPVSNEFGVIWGGGEKEVSNSWTERIKIWIEQSKQRGDATGIMDDEMTSIADHLYARYKSYFNSVKPVTYYGDICSKNVMVHQGRFNGLVDLDGLTQGDPLEGIGRIKLSWYGTHHGKIYTNAVMDELSLDQDQRKLITMYALLNKISWSCENGIKFNQNTKAEVDKEKERTDKKIIKMLSIELGLSNQDSMKTQNSLP